MALARALVTGQPDAGDAAFWDALGIPAEMRAGIVESSGITEIWPESLPAFELFAALQTQWRIGMSGPTGLDYAVLPAVMDMQAVETAERPALFADLRVMESAALKEFSKHSHGR